jgi:hypothetical protein
VRRIVNAMLVLIACALVGCNSAEITEFNSTWSYGHAAKGDRGDEGLTLFERAINVLVDVAENGETDLQRALARETVARIAAGDVWIGPVDQARGLDLWHMCMDMTPDQCGDRPLDREWAGTEDMRVVIVEGLDGYQWGNRLYFTLSDDMDPRALAATLVHEVNHVLNRSECSYYRNFDNHEVDQTFAFLEEFRAFYAECWLKTGAKATVTRCREQAMKSLVDLEYNMTPNFDEIMPGELNPLEQISEELVEPRFWETGSFGYLVPTEDNWPEDFEPCD